MTNKFNFKTSYDQEYLRSLNIALCNHIDEVLEYFGLSHVPFNNYRTLACPVHNGDNQTGLTVYPSNEPYGYWKCNTHGCHKHFPQNLIGLIWGILSASKGWSSSNKMKSSFPDALKLCQGLVGHVNIEKISPRNKILSDIKIEPTYESRYTRQSIRKMLKIPSPYFLPLFKESTLNQFDVGEGNSRDFPDMENRVIVPIYNEDFFFLGCQGRHLNGGLPKWRNSKGLPVENVLYGYNLAKSSVRLTKTIILVEGGKDVWRLKEAGVENVCGLMGGLKGGQKIILEGSGAIHLKCMMDNDQAGDEHYENIVKKCSRLFHVSRINYDKSVKDPGDLTNEQVKRIFNI